MVMLLFTLAAFAQNAGEQAARMASQQTQQQLAIQQTQQASQQAVRNTQAQIDAAQRANQQTINSTPSASRRPTVPFRVTRAPNFSPKPGMYTGTAPTVTITDASKGAVIYFTTDGSPPTEKAQQYTAPIALSSTTTLKAMAIAPVSSQSPTARGKYVVK
jgi:Chitobiase/beta-hexosaminidase C-terminal domain